MAKKKKTKDSGNNSSYSVELTGLILILIGVIGFGFGFIGSLLKKFAMFLAGTWWMIILIALIILGVYMLYKRKMPKFSDQKLIGLYIFFIILLVASHFEFLKITGNPKEILMETYNNYMERISAITANNALNTSGVTTVVIGGGFIGALFTAALYGLFGKTGTIVILVLLGVFASVLTFNVNLSNIFKKLFGLIKFKKKEKHESSEVVPISNSDEVKENVEIKPVEKENVTALIEVVSNEYAKISGSGFEYLFNMHYGHIEKLDDYLKTPIKLSVWRAPTDNDMHIKGKWFGENYHKMHNKVYDVAVKDNIIKVTGALMTVSRQPFVKYEASYEFFANGSIGVSFRGEFDQKRTFLPRLGFEFKVCDKEFEYFGYGPYEAYIDMHHASKMGFYQSNSEKEYVPYIKPQEHGNHYNTKYLKLGDYTFVSQQGFEFKVSDYSASELSSKRHYFELEKDEYTNVRIDYKVSGIGSDSCGPHLAERYQMNDKEIRFDYLIKKNN